MKDRMQQLVRELAEHQAPEKRPKHNRTLYLDQRNYLQLQQYCRSKGLKASDVMDRLLSEFIGSLVEAGELPSPLKDAG